MGYKHGMGNMSSPDFVIHKDGTNYISRDMSTGFTRYSGTDFSTVIQNSIDALPNGRGGWVHLKEGVFEINTPIDLYRDYASGWTPMRLTGSTVKTTEIRLADSSDCNMISYYPDIGGAGTGTNPDGWKFISYLKLNGNRTNNASGHGIFSDDGTGADVGDFHINNVFVTEIKQTGMYLAGQWGLHIHTSLSEVCEEYGIYLGGRQSHLRGIHVGQIGSIGILNTGADSTFTDIWVNRTVDNSIESGSEHNKWTNVHCEEWGKWDSTTLASQAGFRMNGSRNILSNFTIDGNAVAESDYGIQVAGDDNLFANGVIYDADNTGLLIYSGADRNRFYDVLFNSCTTDISDSGADNIINGVAIESANAEEPQGTYPIGAIVEFTDSGDASGDGLYIKDRSGNWVQLD